MIQTLFEIGPFRVHVYGVALAISFLLGTLWAARAAGRRDIAENTILTLAAWILVAAIAGSRLHYVLGHPESFAGPADLFRIWEGGLTLYGGLLAAILASLLYLKRHRVAFLPAADAIAPALALGEGLTRIGCFLNGCCFGRAWDGPLCVHYPPGSYAAYALGDACVYPSQLLLSGAMAVLFFILWRLDRMTLPAGVLLGVYLLGQGIARYAVDFTRHYDPADLLLGGFPWLIAKSQVFALLLAAAGLALVVARVGARGRAHREGGVP